MPAYVAMKTACPPHLGVNPTSSALRKRSLAAVKGLATTQLTMKEAAKMRRDEVIVFHVQGWMDQSCMPAADDILRLFECIERLVKLMEYSFSKLVYPMMIYAERFVRRTAAVKGPELFPLLVTAVTTAMKMWEDYGPDLDLTAHVCGISKKDISTMERAFLEKLNFQLLLTEADVQQFQSVPCRFTESSS